jgi:cystathionine gamma-synthase
MAPVFYDALDVAKGPGFGTNFTLACPYTILAHYHELDWAESCGVDPNLVRIWVGLDPAEHLVETFSAALNAVSAHAKTDQQIVAE